MKEEVTPRRIGAATFTRRRLLAVASAMSLSGLSGCGSDADDAVTPTATRTSTSTSTRTPRPTTATADPTSTTAPTSTARPTTTAAELTDPRAVLTAPSAHHHPLDGYASADWLVEEDPQIIKVTTLDPFGDGSLHEALRTPGPRIITFEVGGVIDLASNTLQAKPVETTVGDLDLSKVFIAGQTAPPPGITLIRGELSPYARNCIVQHVRVRVGDAVDDAYDAISVGSVAGDTIVDHCSASWGVDENVSADGGADVAGKTFSNNLIAEGLYDSIHPKGPHSKGTLLEENQRDITVVGNLYVSHNQRHPRMKGGVHGVVVNNSVYNFGVAIGMGGEGETPTTAAIEGNHFHAGPDTSGGTPIVHGSDSELDPEAYIADTLVEPDAIPLVADGVTRLGQRPHWPEEMTALPAGEVTPHALETAGARPAERTPHDSRILETVTNETGTLIDSQSEVGGYPTLSSTTRTLDPPEYGPEFAAWLAQHTRAVELGETPPDR